MRYLPLLICDKAEYTSSPFTRPLDIFRRNGLEMSTSSASATDTPCFFDNLSTKRSFQIISSIFNRLPLYQILGFVPQANMDWTSCVSPGFRVLSLFSILWEYPIDIFSMGNTLTDY